MPISVTYVTALCSLHSCKDLLICLRIIYTFELSFSTFYPFNSIVLVVLLHFRTVLCRIRHLSHRIIAGFKQIYICVRRFAPTFCTFVRSYKPKILDLGWFLQSSHPFENKKVLLVVSLGLKLRPAPLNFVQYEIYVLF